MGKRIVLFLLTNLAIVVMLSFVLSILGVGSYIGPYGLDIQSLAIFCFVWGMGGAFISLQMSRWIAKRATGVKLIDGRTGRQEFAHLFQALHQLRAVPGSEAGRWARDITRLERQACTDPRRESPIQHRNAVVPVDPEHPPGPGRTEVGP